MRLSLGGLRSLPYHAPRIQSRRARRPLGRPEDDPFFAGGAFRLAVHRFGNVVVGIQPQRGYSIDPKATYHDPDLVPPHHYLAFHAWLRTSFGADAIVHVGKHGNLEWLPGKALGLSATCWPEVALGATPLIYPFIVNDPGEGAQAKRRASAVIVDHLMPAMTRAETYGPLAELETLIDEYYVAAGVDKRRRDVSGEGDRGAGRAARARPRPRHLPATEGGETLRALDAHLCELKEMQIRDGLHTLGASPAGRQRIDTLVAIARTPRSGGRPEDASLHRAIADDLGLGFDPLDCDMAADWVRAAAGGAWRQCRMRRGGAWGIRWSGWRRWRRSWWPRWSTLWRCHRRAPLESGAREGDPVRPISVYWAPSREGAAACFRERPPPEFALAFG
jgi:cobaltochelatase CobN